MPDLAAASFCLIFCESHSVKMRFACLFLATSMGLLACKQANNEASVSPPDQHAAPALDRQRDAASAGDGAYGPERLALELPKRDVTPVDVEVTSVKLSNQGDTENHTLDIPTASFDPKDTVYAEIATNGTASEYTVYAKWVAADGAVLSDYGMRVNEPGLKRTVISLSKPDGWPTGDNRLEIAVNGEPQQVVVFKVQRR